MAAAPNVKEEPSALTLRLFAALNDEDGAAAALQLLDEGADANAVVERKTPLVLAAEHGNPAVVARLIEAGAAVDFVTGEGYSALIVASTHGHAETARLLVRAGADISLVTSFGNTALAKACGGNRGPGSTEIVQLLLEAAATRGLGSAWLNAVNKNDMTALDHAIVKQHEAAADAIRAAGGLTSAEASAALPPGQRLLWASSMHPRTGRLTVDVEVALRAIDEVNAADLVMCDKTLGFTALMNSCGGTLFIARARHPVEGEDPNKKAEILKQCKSRLDIIAVRIVEKIRTFSAEERHAVLDAPEVVNGQEVKEKAPPGALFIAAMSRNEALTKLLLDAGASANTGDDERRAIRECPTPPWVLLVRPRAETAQ